MTVAGAWIGIDAPSEGGGRGGEAEVNPSPERVDPLDPPFERGEVIVQRSWDTTDPRPSHCSIIILLDKVSFLSLSLTQKSAGLLGTESDEDDPLRQVAREAASVR